MLRIETEREEDGRWIAEVPTLPGVLTYGDTESQALKNRDRGEPRGSAPPTPPYVRVRIRRFGGLSSALGHQGCDAERGEEGLREGNVERGAVAQPPGAVGAAGGSCRQLPADAAASQPFVACASAFPLLPGDGTQPSPDPLVELAQHRRGFAEAEVAAPSDQITRQLLGDLREALSARAPRQLPDPCFEAIDGLRRDAAPRLLLARKAEAQELACARFGDRALGLVDPELETLGEELLDALHHPLARPLAAHIDVAVVGVAHEAMAALLQFLVQHVQHQVRQQRRERPALRRALLRRADQPIRQHARGQKAADQLQDALVGCPLGHQPHQDIVVDPVEELLQVDIHHDVVAGRNVRLRLRHRLMRRAPRPKAEAMLGERPVPVGLQHLHHRLLDEAVEHRRNAERPFAARCLRYLHSPYRLRLVSAVEQLRPDRGPVLLQIGRQVLEGHPVDAWSALVGLHSYQCLPQIPTLDYRFHGRPNRRLAFDIGSRRAGFGLLGGGASGFTRRPGAQVQLDLILLPHGPARSPLYLPLPPFRPSSGCPGYYALC